ncbi:hypothetical protein D3C71_1619110 [compost metagenome]
MFTGACRFDGGIEGQQVGLLGNAANHTDNQADVIRLDRQLIDVGRALRDQIGNLPHFLNGRLHDGHAFTGDVARGLRGGLRLSGVVGDVVDAHGKLFDRGRHG